MGFRDMELFSDLDKSNLWGESLIGFGPRENRQRKQWDRFLIRKQSIVFIY